jgi:hypothetical protein
MMEVVSSRLIEFSTAWIEIDRYRRDRGEDNSELSC